MGCWGLEPADDATPSAPQLISLKLLRWGYKRPQNLSDDRRYARNNRAMASCQREAKDAGLGLWEDEDPMPPWEWSRKSYSLLFNRNENR